MDATERLVNLAFYLADASAPASWARIREEVAGYPEGQSEDAFLRMLERDKDMLRSMGFAITATADGLYSIDASQTYATQIVLSDEEAAAIRAAGTALLADESFPFGRDLRLALAKIAESIADEDIPSVAHLADEHPGEQGRDVAILSDAATRRKIARFSYTTREGDRAQRTVHPYGLFLHDGRWYLIALDASKDLIRTYVVARMEDLAIEASRPGTPDFERPADFAVSSYVALPFQYGPAEDSFEAVIRFSAPVAWRAHSLTVGQGRLDSDGDEMLWRVPARSQNLLMRFVLENGPGVFIESPPELRERLLAGIESVVSLHG